jgi:lipopolysaccharide/colanic/teichoic acid biosynthesis glycosyltransferase
VEWIALVGSTALLAVLFERVLFYFSLDRRWRYRLGFLASLVLSLILFFAFTFLRVTPISPESSSQAGGTAWFLAALLAASVGVFTGCLAATAWRETLWEDNAPPPETLQYEVLQIHRQVIGAPSRAPWTKRLFDVILSLGGLIISAPIWFLSLFLVWIEDPGPVLFVKNSVGKGGGNFHQFKIRSMVREAEHATGPVLARETDERVLWIGRFLRKTALDELPQLFNILRGDMSFVGPRPQRTVLVYGYLLNMPEYAMRHCIRPGLAGLAQVAGDYYLTPRQKLRLDLLYIRYQSLGYDLKLLFLAFLLTFWFRWQPGWNGRLPRWLLHPN